ARMATYFPVSIVVHGIALNITVQSYDGALDFGLIACRRAMPDLRELARMMMESQVELLAQARKLAATKQKAAPQAHAKSDVAPGSVGKITKQTAAKPAEPPFGIAAKAKKTLTKKAVAVSTGKSVGKKSPPRVKSATAKAAKTDKPAVKATKAKMQRPTGN
ncbi:MAG TPA: WS/DGAT domain-containing protein, partial [Burkholderiaceae bacterium]|nr:WS/DGAT domain-containing protein [Burkholderiaceae bacterium]